MSSNRFMFRVWAVDYDQYLPENQFVIDQDGELCHYAADMMKVPQTSFVVEQCTGLKDKNGKLIFEGDVFEATVLNSFDGDSMVDERIRGQVAYFTDGTCFTFAAYAPFNLGQIEIIGNIHEMELDK